jgi:hypothetical protein
MKRLISQLCIATLLIGVFLAPMSLGFSADGVSIETAEVFAAPTLEEISEAITGLHPSNIFDTFMESAGTVLVGIGGMVVFIGGTVLNIVIKITILDVGNGVIDSPSISNAWAFFRDLANIFFIFILLYIAIQTIIKGTSWGTKDLLKKVIIVGLLINFSLFFTRVIIDASNVLTVEFYNRIISTEVEDKVVTRDGFSLDIANSVGGNLGKYRDEIDGGLSGIYMSKLKLSSLYSLKGGKIETESNNIIIFSLFATLLLVITGVVFLAAAGLLFIRFCLFIFLLVTAPIAYLGYILPGFVDLNKKWWKTLWDQAIYAPVFMAMSWVSLEIVSGVTASANLSEKGGGSLLKFLTTGNADAAFGTIFGYLISMAFIVGSILIAKSMGINGAKAAIDFTDRWSRAIGGGAAFGATAWGLQRTVGRGARFLGNSQKVQDLLAAGNRTAGLRTLTRIANTGIKKTAEGSLDFRSSRIGKNLLNNKTGIIGNLGEGLGESKGSARSFVKSEEIQIKANEDAQKNTETKFDPRKVNLEKFMEGVASDIAKSESKGAEKIRVKEEAKTDLEKAHREKLAVIDTKINNNGPISTEIRASLEEERDVLRAEQKKEMDVRNADIEKAQKEMLEEKEKLQKEIDNPLEAAEAAHKKAEKKKKDDFVKSLERRAGRPEVREYESLKEAEGVWDKTKVAASNTGVAIGNQIAAASRVPILGLLTEITRAFSAESSTVLQQAADKIKKGKSKKDQIAKLTREIQKEEDDKKKKPEEEDAEEEKDGDKAA